MAHLIYVTLDGLPFDQLYFTYKRIYKVIDLKVRGFEGECIPRGVVCVTHFLNTGIWGC